MLAYFVMFLNLLRVTNVVLRVSSIDVCASSDAHYLDYITYLDYIHLDESQQLLHYYERSICKQL